MRTAAILLLAGMVLAGCQHTRSGPIAAHDVRPVCPPLRNWSADYQRQLVVELEKLPDSHPVWQLARDAVAMRDAIRICRGEAVPSAAIAAVVAELRRQERKRR